MLEENFISAIIFSQRFAVLEKYPNYLRNSKDIVVQLPLIYHAKIINNVEPNKAPGNDIINIQMLKV